jgi:hypothetical protein
LGATPSCSTDEQQRRASEQFAPTKPQRMTPRMQFNALHAMTPDDGGSYAGGSQTT